MNLPLRRFTGRVYRAHHPLWAFAPASGEGARVHGGRFNRPGTAALYTAPRPETAWLEAQQAFAFKAQPMTLCAYRVDCEAVLDLTDAGTLAAADVDMAHLACAWESLARGRAPVPSWAVAERLRAANVACILVRSFAAGATDRDVNAVFWRWTSIGPCRVEMVDDFSRLPAGPR